MSRQSVRWGIISTARIAESAFIPAVRQTKRGRVVAVASRDRAKAEAFARKHDIPATFGDYGSMLASGDIDAVYNPLPNTLHAEWAIAAAEQGKHVFCEKPLAVSPAQAQQMIDACRQAGVLLVEAFVFLSHPQTLKLRQLLDEGVIGQLIQAQAHMTFPLARPTSNIRLDKEFGGGSLFDTGGYPITFARFAFGHEPLAVQAATRIDPDYGVDSRAGILLTFSDERFATLQTGLDAMGGQGAVLFGERGWIEIPQPYHPRAGSRVTVHAREGAETFDFDIGVVPFTPAVERFHDCILDGVAPPVSPENAIGTLRVIDAVLESGRTGERVAIKR